MLVYCTGMSHPAKGTIFAPSRTCSSESGVFLGATVSLTRQSKQRSDCMQRWIGFSEDDGRGFAKGANVRRQSRIYCYRVEDNAIHLARKLRAFTVRRDDLARQTRTAPRFSRCPGGDANRGRSSPARLSVGSFEPWLSFRGSSRSRA